MFAVTSLTSSSISVTLTIHTPVLLNGTRIACGGQTVTLDVLSSKVLLVIMKIMIKEAKTLITKYLGIIWSLLCLTFFYNRVMKSYLTFSQYST